MRLEPNDLKTLLGAWTAPGQMLGPALADRMIELIRLGELVPGVRLPARRRLGLALNVSHNTIGSAYELLRTQGLLDYRDEVQHLVPQSDPGTAIPVVVTVALAHRDGEPG